MGLQWRACTGEGQRELEPYYVIHWMIVFGFRVLGFGFVCMDALRGWEQLGPVMLSQIGLLVCVGPGKQEWKRIWTSFRV